MAELTINVGGIRNVPAYAEPIIRAIGIASINWGRMEQHLVFLLQFLRDERFDMDIPKIPDMSFQVKRELFQKLYGNHPKLAQFHEFSKGVSIGLKKANESRVNIVHCNVQSFSEGPPLTVHAKIVKFKGRDAYPADGEWTLGTIEEFNSLLCALSDDLVRLTGEVMSPEFRQSLERGTPQVNRDP